MLIRMLLASALALTGISASAQTTAAGPYYATPSWDQTMPAASRFVVLSNFNNDAVLDRETGLVWMRTFGGAVSYLTAQEICSANVVGGRAGWRLPTIEELTSLDDFSAGIGQLPSLFRVGGADAYTYFWSNTSTGKDRILIWLFSGAINTGSSDGTTPGLNTAASYVCVRGGSRAGS
jgi:hypothetical protein